MNNPNKTLDPKALGILWNKYIGVNSLSAKQHAFLLLNDTREVFYGGSARGGKTISLLINALQYIDYPEYRALLLRSTYPQLSMSGGLLDVAKHWLKKFDPEVKYKADDKTFTFPSGATIKFGFMQSEDDKFNYLSSEFHFIGFDEITDFSETQYTFLFTRLTKRAGCVIPLRMRAASNPIGKGFEWVRNRFIIGKNTNDRRFLPASLWDNPYVDQEEYVKSLDNLDPITREKILRGDWNVREESVMFKAHWFKVIPECPAGIADAVRVWDMAGTSEKDATDKSSFTAGVLMARLYDRTFCVLDIVRFQGSPKEVEETVKSTAIRDGKNVDVYIEQEGGSSGKAVIDHYARNVLLGWTFNPVSPTGSKVARASPLASYIEKGYFSFVSRALTPEVLDEFLMSPLGKYSDCVDAAAHAFNILAVRPMPTMSTSVYSDIYRKEKKYINW
jgi:predicted phage terminase large subunit-like protein